MTDYFKSVDNKQADEVDMKKIRKTRCLNCTCLPKDKGDSGLFVWLRGGELIWWHTHRCR